MEGSVRLVREDVGIARLVLARPEKRNALTDRMIDSLIRHMESLQWEPSEKLRFLVLEAEGDFFCSGSDVDELKKTGELSGDDNIREAFIFARLFRELSALPFPTIAMVRGGALGAAAGILACGPESLRKIKLMHLKISPLPENEIEEFAAMQNAEARASEEGREGMTAFRETRPPKWLAKKNDKGCS